MKHPSARKFCPVILSPDELGRRTLVRRRGSFGRCRFFRIMWYVVPFLAVFISSLPIISYQLPITNISAQELSDSDSADESDEFKEDLEEEYKDQLESLEDKKKEYEDKIAKLQSEERTLQNEIDYMTNQIYLTSLKINETEAKITAKEEELDSLKTDIGDLQERILTLGELLDSQRAIFASRARESYKSSRFTSFEVLFGVANLSRLVERIKYLQVLEIQDQRLLGQMETTREGCTMQKELLEIKKMEVEEVKTEIETYQASLVSQRANLAQQKKDKEWILSTTKGKEQEYQRMLDAVRSEIASIAAALAGGIKIGKVEKGDVIAREGNTGCCCSAAYGCQPPPASHPSAGSHLHFGVYKDGKAVNPRKYLGDEFGWPEKNTVITQEFGENYSFYMRNFGVPGHNGLDMSSGYGSPIYAAADGVAYLTGDSQVWSSWCNGQAKGVRIDHGDGLQTIYWHVQ